MSRMTQWRRLNDLNLITEDLLDKKVNAAFGLTFAEPKERFNHFKAYVDLRSLLADHGIKSKKDLEGHFRGLNTAP